MGWSDPNNPRFLLLKTGNDFDTIDFIVNITDKKYRKDTL